MARHPVKTEDIVRLLEGLGFSRTAKPAHHVFRREAEAPGERPVIIALPAVRVKALQPAVVAYVGRQLDEAGLLAREDFERKIEKS